MKCTIFTKNGDANDIEIHRISIEHKDNFYRLFIDINNKLTISKLSQKASDTITIEPSASNVLKIK